MPLHRFFAAAVMAAAMAPVAASHAAPAAQRPNILVIMSDDVGHTNVGLYSHGMMVPTPNIDRIGREGLLFTDHYAEPSCTPGRAAFVTPDFVKPGATVIDVGTTRVEDRVLIEQWYTEGSKRRAAFEKRGALVMGDVHPAVEQVAGALTPVPGGVGPLTIAMLLKNTVRAAHDRLNAR